MADLNLLVGQSSTGTINPLDTNGQPSGGVLSNQTWSVADPSVTVTQNADGTAGFQGVTATTSDILGVASSTVTDTNGVVSQLSRTFTISVGSVTPPPGAITTSLGLTFTTPV